MAAVESAKAARATPPPAGILSAPGFGNPLGVGRGGPNAQGGGGRGGGPGGANAGPIPSVDETIDIIRQLVAKGVTAARVGTRSWMSLTDSELSRLNAAKKELDFDFVEVGTYRNPMHPDSTVRSGYIKECIANIEACENVGCRCIGVTRLWAFNTCGRRGLTRARV